MPHLQIEWRNGRSVYKQSYSSIIFCLILCSSYEKSMKKNSLIKSGAMIIILTLICRVLGAIRDMVIAAKFGSGVVTDVYFLALSAVSLFSVYLKQAIHTTGIPILSTVKHDSGYAEKNKATNNLLFSFLLLSVVVAILAFIYMPFVMRILGTGLDIDNAKEATKLARIGLPSIFFIVIIGVYRACIQCEDKFAESAFSEVPYNLIYILYLAFFSSSFGIDGLMVAGVIAVGSQILLQIPTLKRSGYKLKPYLNIKDKYIVETAKLVPPVCLSLAVDEINKLVDKAVASMLPAGSISALTYSARMKSLVIGSFSSAIFTVIYPKLSREALENDYNSFKKTMLQGSNLIHMITVPATVGLIVLAKPIIQVLYQRGQFDANATTMTSEALLFYAIGLSSIAIRTLLNRGFFSLKDTKTPLIAGCISMIVNVVLDITLREPLQHKGLALATSVAAIVNVLVLYIVIQRKIGRFDIKYLVTEMVKIFASAIIMGIVTFYAYRFISSFLPVIIALVLSVLIGAIVYSICAFLLKVEELKSFINILTRRIKKKEKTL